MTTHPTWFSWSSFLRDWSGEWADTPADDATVTPVEADEVARRERWLGFPAASEERIAALEERLGRRLPPSYREFLAVSDGWRHAGGFITLLAGTADACWHRDASGLAEMFEGFLDDDPSPEELRDVAVWRRGLQLDVQSDATRVVLDPGDVDEDGEWAVYTWASWLAAPPRRFPDFAAFMRAMHGEFHRLRARAADGEPELACTTTRRLDAQVEQARIQALGGEWERAGRALEEAAEYGRPAAAGLRDQMDRLLGRTNLAHAEELVTDPRYAPELLPPLVAEHAAHRHRDDTVLTYRLRGAGDDVVALAHTLLEQVRSGTYRYTAAGPFGEAVDRARESARWGDTDEAWRTMREALPLWQPLGPDHLAPLGWLADPLLGPLLTPERGRELLSAPRGGQPGEPRRESDAARSDPEGLAWLADQATPGAHTSYRFVLVEGVEPQELPGLLADGKGTGLDEPMTSFEARSRWRQERREVSVFDDRALVAVGRAAARWSFAFDCDGPLFAPQQFGSPVAACADARTVVVWAGPRDRNGAPFFHLSVARGGAELYTFTCADGEVRRAGPIPPGLAPDRFFGAGKKREGAEAAIRTERALLEAVADEFGVRLPRHAITRGRLHTFTTRPWSRPPGDGEARTAARLEWRPN
ncbi:SMI1/KNR4 family protein [Streptomyces sp. NPDC004041]|uniref:SMI1/KNR4 family protein n=1 Tax=Streptomyces sp. NPDC004041 TaxID=3364688 RepID=UPI0036A042D5